MTPIYEAAAVASSRCSPDGYKFYAAWLVMGFRVPKFGPLPTLDLLGWSNAVDLVERPRSEITRRRCRQSSREAIRTARCARSAP